MRVQGTRPHPLRGWDLMTRKRKILRTIEALGRVATWTYQRLACFTRNQWIVGLITGIASGVIVSILFT